MLERWDSMAAMLRKQPHQLRVRYLEFEVVLSILEGLVELLDCSMLAADDFGSDLSLHRVPGASAFAAHALQMQARLTGSWSGGALINGVPAGRVENYCSLEPPAGFNNGAGISRLLDTRSPVVVAMYLQSVAADNHIFAIVPASARYLDDVVGARTDGISASCARMSQFRRTFDMLLSAGVAAAFPVNLQLRHAVSAVYSSTAQWVGGFAPPLKLLPGMVKYKCKYLTAMGALLQSQQAPLVLRLDAIPVSSELHQASQQLSAAAMAGQVCCSCGQAGVRGAGGASAGISDAEQGRWQQLEPD
jgi:hypothetical protein